ncbi:MAG: hypothetical protein H7336_15815 [Bacteriovorax sp.]|nr:hypothetical protein [Bacteriovorax sp.]
MMVKLRIRPLLKASAIIMLLSMTFPRGVYAEDCIKIIKEMLVSFDKNVADTIDIDANVNHRNFIAQFAKKNNIPVFLKQNSKGVDIPVILLNKTTGKKLQNFLENSFGTEVGLQPDYNNDHGLLRAGKYIIDLDSPGARGYGEIEETGLAWKNVDSYLARRTVQSSPTLEVSYLLTPNEKSVIDYYQKVRRAALFRVKFTFGGFDGQEYPNLLKNGGEHCFIFCKAQGVFLQASEIKSRLIGLGIADPDGLLNDAKAKLAIQQVQHIMNETGPDDLHSMMLSNKSMLALFKDFYPKTVKTDKDRLDILNWIISYDSTKKYYAVMKDLGVSGDYGIGDAMNSRASVIFVYDEGADPAAFKNATYTNNGKMVSWPQTKQYPVN